MNTNINNDLPVSEIGTPKNSPEQSLKTYEGSSNLNEAAFTEEMRTISDDSLAPETTPTPSYTEAARVELATHSSVLSAKGAALLPGVVCIESEETGASLEVSNLESLSMTDLARAELALSEAAGLAADRALLHVGYGRCKEVSKSQARGLQIERIMDEEEALQVRALGPSLSEDAVVLSPPASYRLGGRVAALLGTEGGEALVDRFPNSETRIEVLDSVRDKHVYITMPMATAVNEAVMNTALLIQAVKLADARRITVMLPYYGYSRQDRRADTRPPISAKAVAQMYQTMGADNLLTVDLHARQIEGFFDGPFDNLDGLPHMVPHILEAEGTDLVTVSPDAGGSKRAQRFADHVSAESGEYSPLLIMSKFRGAAGEQPRVTLTASDEYVEGRTCVLVDDMVDTGGSIMAAAKALKERGAARVIIAATHGIFSNNAVERLQSAVFEQDGETKPLIDRVYVSDTVPLHDPRSEFLRVVSLAPLLAEAVKQLSTPGGRLGHLNGRRDLGRLLPSHS